MLEIIRSGIHVAKNSKAVSSKDSRSNKEKFGVSCNNKINWEALYEWRVYVVIHRGLSMEGNCKSDTIKSQENIGENLRILLVQQTIICNKGLSGRSIIENLESKLVKSFHPNRREVRVLEYRSRNKRS